MGQASKIVVLAVVLAVVPMAAAVLTTAWFLTRTPTTPEIQREAVTFHPGDLLGAPEGDGNVFDTLSSPFAPGMERQEAHPRPGGPRASPTQSGSQTVSGRPGRSGAP